MLYIPFMKMTSFMHGRDFDKFYIKLTCALISASRLFDPCFWSWEFVEIDKAKTQCEGITEKLQRY